MCSLRAGKALQTVATTRHLSPSDSTISGAGSHLLTKALHRSYANIMAKSSLFLIINVIVYAKMVHLASDCLAPRRSPLIPA